MNKPTFIQFLTETDYADLALIKDYNDRKARELEMNKGKEPDHRFDKDMAGTTPVKGDVIQGKAGLFTVVDLDRNGITVKQPDMVGDKTKVLAHGTEFKNTGKKGPNGTNIFVIVK